MADQVSVQLTALHPRKTGTCVPYRALEYVHLWTEAELRRKNDPTS